MKLNKVLLSFATLTALAFVSCSEGKYWESPKNPGEAYAFLKPSATVIVADGEEFPESYSVTVRRSNNQSADTVPVAFTSNSDQLTGPSEVVFAKGSYQAEYVISMGKDMQMGKDYQVNLQLTEPENALIHVNKNNQSYTFKISKAYKWETVGTVQVTETLFGAETPTDVPLQMAVNNPDKSVKLMRLASPFYYMFGEDTAKGVNLLFYLNADDSAKDMYVTDGFQYIGVEYEGEGFLYFGVISKYGGSFTNEGNVYTMDGIMAAADTNSSSSPTPKWYETIQFTWNK